MPGLGLDEFREHLGGQLTIALIDAIGRQVSRARQEAMVSSCVNTPLTIVRGSS